MAEIPTQEKGDKTKVGVMVAKDLSKFYNAPGSIVVPEPDLKTKSDGSQKSWAGPTEGKN